MSGTLGMDNILSNGAIRLGGWPAGKALHRLVLLVVTILFGFIPDQLRAADISVNLTQAERDMGCFSVLRGVISAGDVERVTDFLAQNRPANVDSADARFDGFGRRICLDSPGGSLLEAVRLVGVITSLGTAIASGAVCESACAILFMGGAVFIPGVEGYTPDRVMHPQATLGFHAPALQVANGQYNETQVKEAYNKALETIAMVSELRKAAEVVPRVRPSLDLNAALFQAFIATPPNDMRYIKSVDEAVLFGIQLSNEGRYNPSPRAALNNLCDFERAFHYNTSPGETVTERDNDFIVFAETDSPRSVIYQSIEGNYSPLSDQLKCFVQIFSDSESASARAGLAYPDFENPVDFLSSISSVASYPPNANLSITENGIRSTEFQAMAARIFSPIDSESCSLPGVYGRVVNVTDYTNLRSRAGLQNPVIARVPLHTTITQPYPGRYLATQRCLQACEGGNQTAIQQCIDNNEVWIEVRYNNRSGFLSRRFLRSSQ
jgi:hypothetical protein